MKIQLKGQILAKKTKLLLRGVSHFPSLACGVAGYLSTPLGSQFFLAAYPALQSPKLSERDCRWVLLFWIEWLACRNLHNSQGVLREITFAWLLWHTSIMTRLPESAPVDSN